MWRERDRYGDHQSVPDTFWLLMAALLFAACGLETIASRSVPMGCGPNVDQALR
jgi:hypothetical protein